MHDRPAWEALVEQVRRLWAGVRDAIPSHLWSGRTARELMQLARPVDPFNYFDLAAPIIGLAGLLVGLLLAGVALASLATLLTSLLALGLLLTEVYGVTLEVRGVPPHA